MRVFVISLILVTLAVLCASESRIELSQTAMNFRDATNHCLSMGMKLLEIDSHSLNNQVYKMMRNEKGLRRIWIGIHRIEDTDSRPWNWIFASNKEPSTVQFWGPEEPNNFRNHSERCVEVRLLSKNNEKSNWNDAPCSHVNQFFCSKLF